MTTPGRLLAQSTDSFELELLRSATLDRGSEQALARALGAFSAVTPPLAVPPTAPVGLGAVALKGAAVGLLVGVGCFVGVGVAHYQTRAKASLLVVTHAGASKSSTATAQRVESAPSAAPALGEARPPAPARKSDAVTRSAGSQQSPRAHASARTPHRATTSSSALDTALADEIALLDLARRQLANGNFAGAEAALDRHDEAGTVRVLAPEATLLRVQASLLAGDLKTAKQLAQAFIAQHPRGPHADRLRQLLSETNR